MKIIKLLFSSNKLVKLTYLCGEFRLYPKLESWIHQDFKYFGLDLFSHVLL